MAKALLKWSLVTVARMITCCLLNKFDFFIAIEGGTGIGKSTLAFWIAKKVHIQFRKLYNLEEETIEYYYENVSAIRNNMTKEQFCEFLLELKQKKAYNFQLRKDLIYSQNEMMKALSSYNRIFIPDEMINVTFNRDFYSEEQKNIIKMINMYRDHNNLFIACIPSFLSLDNQIKNLCKVRFTVLRRGLALMQSPNKTIHIKDRWDTATNEKLEREWLVRDSTRPAYSRLTTTRGICKFPPMPDKFAVKYQQIKDDKRAKILKDEMNVKNEDEKEPIDIVTDKLINGQIRNTQTLEGFAISQGITLDKLRGQIAKKLKELGKPTLLSVYFWDKKGKKNNESSEISDDFVGIS